MIDDEPTADVVIVVHEPPDLIVTDIPVPEGGIPPGSYGEWSNPIGDVRGELDRMRKEITDGIIGACTLPERLASGERDDMAETWGEMIEDALSRHDDGRVEPERPGESCGNCGT